MLPSSYSRSELQQLAKANGVRANSKSTVIISELKKLGVFSNAKKLELCTEMEEAQQVSISVLNSLAKATSFALSYFHPTVWLSNKHFYCCDR